MLRQSKTPARIPRMMAAQCKHLGQHPPTKAEHIGARVPIKEIRNPVPFLKTPDAIECIPPDQQCVLADTRLRPVRYNVVTRRSKIDIGAYKLLNGPEDSFQIFFC